MSAPDIHDIAGEIGDFADLLVILFSAADAENATDGARLVALEIGARADKIKEAVKPA
ncbi:hypothetical protein JJB99_19290 [Bradyrhizobium diazoefficiens]|uniref:hypothetical protein n=1 Tax=Bradyrhizobium diazoefficiens TaxID=1355477 RepID=UPI001909B13F|nr:hypothetical protein [Bradyrhizobium diazoefficiens]QQO11662.1 hypothetical protein JJB99_19290 [Bradyrhizobium diazoefficiens]